MLMNVFVTLVKVLKM